MNGGTVITFTENDSCETFTEWIYLLKNRKDPKAKDKSDKLSNVNLLKGILKSVKLDTTLQHFSYGKGKVLIVNSKLNKPDSLNTQRLSSQLLTNLNVWIPGKWDKEN